MPAHSNMRFVFFGLTLIFVITFISGFAQKPDTSSCISVTGCISAQKNIPSGIQIENNTKNVIKCLFEFSSNGFFDEESLKRAIMMGVDTSKSKEYNQFLILDNIARIIKSPNHRNFQFIFSTSSSSVSNKKYSPLCMISSFYDKQCNDYQRLAAQLAILTPYFKGRDFINYNIYMHNVIDVIIGRDTIFHDFDPGQPGFRFYKNTKKDTFASLHDLLKNPQLIKKDQFYKYNGVSLCPWIGESYYQSLFTKISWQSSYSDIDKVFGFIPKWIIPPGVIINSAFPDTFLTNNLNIKILFDKKEYLVKKTFSSYSKYLLQKDPKDSLKTIYYINKHLRKKYNYDFGFGINYFFFLSNGIIEQGDSNSIQTFAKNYHINVSINTENDTLTFLKDFLIPLPLSKVRVKQGEVKIIETELTDNGWKNFVYKITDSLTFNLFNNSLLDFATVEERKLLVPEANTLVYGPSKGYILPHSKVEFEYFFNPFYYRFHDLLFKIRYIDVCDNKLDITIK